MTHTLDYIALTEPLTETDIARYKQHKGIVWDRSFLAPIVILALPAALVLGASLVDGSIFLFVSFLLQFGILGFLIHFFLQRSLKSALRRRAKLYKFTLRNGLQLVSDLRKPGYPGSIFDNGDNRRIHDALRFSGGMEIGNYTYMTGSGKYTQTHNWGYVRVKLARRLPHMVLDAKSNNFWKLSNLSDTFRKSQILTLEGDFNNYFTLYAPQQYERDALYVFTPDVMAAMVDYGKDYDIEIVDDDLFIYSSEHFLLDTPEVYNRLLPITAAISTELINQTDYYADERVGDRASNVIAPEGRRLKSGLRWVIVVILVFFVYFSIIYPMLSR